MRKVSETPEFPFSSKLLCYILVGNDCTVAQVPHINKGDFAKMAEAISKVRAGEATLYAVWPGNWRSDLFIVDNIDGFVEYVMTRA